MHMFMPVALCAAFAVVSGCATQAPVAVKVPPSPASVAIGKSNRFEMTQYGRQMSAEDFDAWMKARGIRIAKGPQATKPAPKPKVQAKRRFFRIAPARQPLLQELTDHDPGAFVVRPPCVVAQAFAVVARCAGDREVACVVVAVADQRGECGSGTLAEPRLRYDVFQRRVAQGFAVVAYEQATAAMQTPGFPLVVAQLCFAVGRQRKQEQPTQGWTHLTL